MSEEELVEEIDESEELEAEEISAPDSADGPNTELLLPELTELELDASLLLTEDSEEAGETDDSEEVEAELVASAWTVVT